jgi:hypothetical protein
MIRLLRPACRCPRCQSPPRWRIPSDIRERYMADPPDREVGTYQCHVSGCGAIYTVRARDYQRAA